MFAHHREVMNGIAKKLDHDKVAYIRIDGDTKQQDRQVSASSFKYSALVDSRGFLWITSGVVSY